MPLLFIPSQIGLHLTWCAVHNARSAAVQNTLQFCRILFITITPNEVLFFQGNVIDIGIDIVDVLRIQDKVEKKNMIVLNCCELVV